jgi:membrane-bound inhibitor of C-type lysozyme
MRLMIAAALTALLLAGCASVAPMDAITDSPIPYACAGGRSFTAVYRASGKKAVVSAGGVSRTLSLAKSASGARYEGGGYEIWSKGESATLKGFPGGPYSGCSAG